MHKGKEKILDGYRSVVRFRSCSGVMFVHRKYELLRTAGADAEKPAMAPTII